MIDSNRDIKGKRFGRLTALSFVTVNKHGYNCWEFKCDCGQTIICTGSEVWRGRRKSCGCLRWETMAKANLKHGCRFKRVYRIWQGMRRRCSDKRHIAYSRYGGRGIKVCKRWGIFVNFLQDMGHPESMRFSLERVDNNKGYSPANCRWASKKEQNRNSRGNVIVKLGGKKACLAEWADRFKKDYRLVWSRYRRLGWSLTRALTEPLHTEKRRFI